MVENDYLTRFEKLYLDRLGVARVGDTLEPETPSDQYTMIHGFFEDIRAGLSRHDALLVEAEAAGLRDLWELTNRAYRRPLTDAEQASYQGLYDELRGEGQSVEGACEVC
ncbi:MAG: hypothetical protein R3B96_02025 [Pirellulaceae bacterium]